MDAENEKRNQRRIEEFEGNRDTISRVEGVGELRQLSEKELIERDAVIALQLEGADSPHLHYGERIDAYRAELLRRENARQGERMEALTRSLNRLTWAIAIATFIGVAIAALTLLSGA